MSYNVDLQNKNTRIQTLIDKVNNLPEATDPVLQDKTVSPSTSIQTVNADSNYDGLNTVTVNAIPTVEQATPNITINPDNGEINASSTQAEGYVVSGTKSSKYQMNIKQGSTITPSNVSQTAILKDYYATGNITVNAVPTQTKSVTPTSATQNVTPDNGKFLSKVTVNGDSNLVAENIKSGVSIFGVAGTHSGSSSGGGEIETCSVEIYFRKNGNYAYVRNLTYTELVEGQCVVQDQVGLSGTTEDLNYIIENVVCNTPIILNVSTDSQIFASDYGGSIEFINDQYQLPLYFYSSGSNGGYISVDLEMMM